LLVAQGTVTGSAVVNSVPGAHTAQGGSNNISLGVTNAAGSQSGTVQLNFSSTQTGSSSTRVGTAVSVGSRTITVNGTGYTGRSTWNVNADGSWGNTTTDFNRWDANGGTPGLDGTASVGDTATFGDAATAARTITLDGAAPQLRELNFNNASNSYTIAKGTGNGSIGLGNATNAGAMNNSAGSHTVSADIVLGNRLTYTGAAGTTTTLSGGISGTDHGLTKSGAGTLRLTGSNSFSGTTTVTAGTLIVNGTSASATTVNSGATLGGSGTISGATTISGIHSPGNSPGLQTFGNGLTYDAGASVLWELIANSTSDRGTNYDAINVTGNLNFAGATTLALDFDFTGSAVDWSNSFWDTSKTGTNGWEIFKVTGGTITGANNLTLGGSLMDAVIPGLLDSTRGEFSLTQIGNSIYLNYTIASEVNAIPETSASLLGVLSASLLLRRRRRSA
jgi:autotransporter-associated beta strand protein